jgi:transcriptional regulator with XRE-family HTH domain
MTGVCENLRAAIRKSGLSLGAISDASGVAKSQLSRLMHGKPLTARNIERVATAHRLEIIVRRARPGSTKAR